MPPPREVSNSSASDSDDSSSSSSTSGSQTTSRSGTSTTVTATTTGTGTGTTTTTTTSGNKRVSFQKGKSGNRSTASRTTTGTTATTGTGTTTATSTSGTGDSGSSDSDDETTNTTSQTATNGGPNMRTTTASGSDSSSDDSDTDSDSDSSGSDSTDGSSDSGTESATSARTGTSGTTTGTGTTRTSGTGTSRSTKTGTSTTSGTSKTTTQTHTTSGSSKTTSSSKTNTTQTSTGTTGTSGTSGTSKTTSSSGTKTSNTSGTTTSSGAKSSTSGRDKLDQTATGATTTDANNESVTESTTSTSSSTRTGTGSTMTSTSDRTGTTSSRTPHTPRSASTSVRDASSSQANTARDLKIPKIIIPDPPKRDDILKNGSMSQVPQGTTPSTPRGTAKFPSVSTPTIIPEGAKEALADNTGAPLEGANGANVAIKGSDGGESKTDSKEGSRYDGVNESTSTESSTIRTVDGSVENSPSRMPVTTLQSRVVRKEIGIAAATNVIRTDKLPLAYMIRYRSSLDYVHSVLGSIAAAHFEKEKDLAEADKTPSGSLMASVARSTLRSFGVDEASIKSDCGDLKHLTLPLVQASIERSLLKRIPTLFMQKFKKIDDCQSGEVSLLECNRLLINSKIGACSVGEHSKVTVKLALFRRSLGVSVQQFSDQAEYFDLAPSANFRISVNTGNNDVIINDTYTISNLVTAEKDQLVQ